METAEQIEQHIRALADERIQRIADSALQAAEQVRETTDAILSERRALLELAPEGLVDLLSRAVVARVFELSTVAERGLYYSRAWPEKPEIHTVIELWNGVRGKLVNDTSPAPALKEGMRYNVLLLIMPVGTEAAGPGVVAP